MSDRGDRSASEEPQKARDENGRRSRSRSKSPSRSRKSRSYSKSRSRSRSRSVSRSRSRSRSRNFRKRYSRSRSRSPYSKSRRSPMSSHKRHYGSRNPTAKRSQNHNDKSFREDPPKSNCLGIFGLSLYTTERDLKDFLEKYGTVSSCQLVYDHQSGRSRGFAFAYFPDTNEAAKVKEETSGLEIDGRRIRVDYSITQRAHTPTPGVYMGKPAESGSRKSSDRRSPERNSGSYSRDKYRDRDYGSRDQYSSRDRDYSRSRSRSPRRY